MLTISDFMLISNLEDINNRQYLLSDYNGLST